MLLTKNYGSSTVFDFTTLILTITPKECSYCCHYRHLYTSQKSIGGSKKVMALHYGRTSAETGLSNSKARFSPLSPECRWTDYIRWLRKTEEDED